jgi:hypothetical protein
MANPVKIRGLAIGKGSEDLRLINSVHLLSKVVSSGKRSSSKEKVRNRSSCAEEAGGLVDAV